MGSLPLRMKVRWGCPPRVLSPPPHRTQSWRPCLPGQPWASGWRSTDRPVPSPRGWMIGFSERGAAHNRALPRCLSSQRCMRSWRVRGWPLSRPRAARPPPPSSLPSMAEWPGGTRAQVERAVAVHLCPRNAATWRNRPRLPSKACKLTAALAAKAYSAAGQAASALHAMAILQVHQAKALKQVHEGSTDPELMQELRTVTDFALRAWSNAFSPRIGLQRSTWRTLTFTFRSFGLSLSPRVFTKVVEGALTPLREVGVRILNYLDNWLILAQSREQMSDHRDLLLRHLSQLGVRVNLEKSKLSPVQRISFLGVELDSVSMTARLTEERAKAVLNCLSSFRGRNVVPLKQFQRLLGHMAFAAAVTPLGLLHMRPLQHWLHSRVPRWAWRRCTLRVGISQQCRRSLSPWTDLAFLRAGVPLEQVSRQTVVTTDASSTGWGATRNGQAASGLWTGPRLLWHINCPEASHAPWGWGLTPPGVLPPPMRWRTVPLWQTSAELRAGRHWTPSQDSTIFALSQFLPVYWVSNGREELAGVTLAAPFPLTQGYERLFLPQFSSPDGEPWWNPPSTPGSQTGRSSLTPGPVLVLARPGLRSAPVLG